MVSLKNVLVLASALLPFAVAVPASHPGLLKIRAMDETAGMFTFRNHMRKILTIQLEIIPGRYIVVFEESVNATVIQAHEEGLVKLRKRDITADVDNTYSVEEFKGYSITTDETTIAEIAASPEVCLALPVIHQE
jgi:hypothetical protein